MMYGIFTKPLLLSLTLLAGQGVVVNAAARKDELFGPEGLSVADLTRLDNYHYSPAMYWKVKSDSAGAGQMFKVVERAPPGGDGRELIQKVEVQLFKKKAAGQADMVAEVVSITRKDAEASAKKRDRGLSKDVYWWPEALQAAIDKLDGGHYAPESSDGWTSTDKAQSGVEIIFGKQATTFGWNNDGTSPTDQQIAGFLKDAKAAWVARGPGTQNRANGASQTPDLKHHMGENRVYPISKVDDKSNIDIYFPNGKNGGKLTLDVRAQNLRDDVATWFKIV